MAAGIVASTLRRKAFHRRLLDGGNRYQTVSVEPGHTSVSPTDETTSSAAHVTWTTFSSSHGATGSGGGGPGAVGGRRSLSNGTEASNTGGYDELSAATPIDSSTVGSSMLPRGAQLCRVDFWPRCINPTETNMRCIEFETFDTLVPKANDWFADNISTRLVKCETIEKKVSSVDELASDNIVFAPSDRHAVYVKGLRLWYINLSTRKHTTAHVPVLQTTEIGYMNVIPKCLDGTGKYPIYENLPETYSAINMYLTANPLEGKIVTIETLAMKLPRKQWGKYEINPDQTCFHDDYSRHILYITRIYFQYGTPEIELIGAQDFLPDFEPRSHCYGSSVYGQYPQYSPLLGAMRKVKEWMKTTQNIHVTNIQTLQAAYKKRPGTVHTGVNFVDKSEHCPTVRFVRITYVRPATSTSTFNETNANAVDRFAAHSQLLQPPPNDTTATRAGGSTEAGLAPLPNAVVSAASAARYSSPIGFSYKTLLPAPVKIAMCSGRPEYEALASTLERSRTWLKLVDRRIVSVETFYHPLKRIWFDQDGCETTVMHGEWTTGSRSDRFPKRRRHLVSVVRVYLDGDYQEPPCNLLPPTPMVEEINDCQCNVM